MAVTDTVNPYRRAGKILNAQDLRNLKVRQTMRQKARPNETPYTWTMGYNNCVGRYSAGQAPTLSGSSLNRTLNNPDAKKLCGWKKNFIAACRKAKPFFTGLGQGWPLFAHVFSPTAETERRYIDWVQALAAGGALSIRLPIHVLSQRSRGKIRDKATAFFRSCPGQRVFATLTFVAACDDGRAVSILNKFLTEARKKFPGFQYLWVAERQDNNKAFPGNIHFHAIINRRLPVGRWNAFWILAQYNAGLVGKDKYGRYISKAQILEAYALDAKEKFRNKRLQQIFNPFDVRKVDSITRLSWYLTKYITKQDKGARFACLAWHCSRRVSRMFTRALVGPSAFRYMQSFANWAVNKETGEMFAPVVQTGAFWVVIYSANKSAPLKYLRELEQVNKWIGEGLEISALSIIDDDLYRSLFLTKQS